MQKLPFFFTGSLALIAMVYNSWPLGYLLDSSTARYGLPSDLEYTGHPYDWLFIAGDVIVGLGLIFLSIYLYRAKQKINFNNSLLISLCLGLFLFGFFTGFGADSPDKCDYKIISVCVHIGPQQISPDSIETSLAASGLLLALLSSAVLSMKSTKTLRLISWAAIGLWAVSGTLIITNALTNVSTRIPEQIFLISCGLGLVSIGLNIDDQFNRQYKRSYALETSE